MALPGMGVGANRIGRLDLPPPAPWIERTVFGGAMALFVYLLPDMEANAAALGVVISSWQGILFWKAGWGEAPAPHQKNK